MNGHEKRKQKKMAEIKAATIELCNTYGTQKVSIDEIADKAKVSKATIYKYFNGKEDLIDLVISEIYGKILHDTKEMILNQGDFLEKLQRITKAKIEAIKVFKGDFLKELFTETNSEALSQFNQELKSLMYAFYDQGKEQGYINRALDNHLIFTYSEVFISGFQHLLLHGKIPLQDETAIAQMIELYFYGLIKPEIFTKSP